MNKAYKILFSFLLVLVTSLGFSQSVPSYVPTNGLVGWWGFNGNAQDGSGNGNHGTVNGATLTTDRFGNQNGAYDFDGVNDNVLVQMDSNLAPIGKSYYSYSIWFQGNPGDGILMQIFTGTFINLSNYDLGYSNSYVNFNHFPFVTNIQSPFTTPQFTWTNVVVVVNQLVDSVHFFRNGFFWYSGAISSLEPSAGLLSFGAVINGAGAFKGKLDDIGIWNRALSPQEITNLYNSQLPTQTSLCLPTITTASPSSVGVDTVVIGGDISNDGGSSIVLRGVCYSTSPNPNMGNQRTEDGSGTGSFNTVLRGLTSSTTYYARSYAKNSNGVVVYGNEVSFTTSSITIGSSFAGGIVFYIDQTGQHGLVCAPFDQGTAPWGLYGVDVPGTSSSFGTGAQNTAAIVAYSQSGYGALNPASAALMCDTLSLNGYTDWYLPSQHELFTLHSVLHANSNNIGGFSNQWYWSSSQGDFQNVSVVLFDGGSNNYLTGFHKNSIQPVRAIRSF
jgi:hypothetical protein